jgi:hypothetical protein
MNVTRLTKGYRIRLSDSEYIALSCLVENGANVETWATHEEYRSAPLQGHAKGVLRKLLDNPGRVLNVTDDRRSLSAV